MRTIFVTGMAQKSSRTKFVLKCSFFKQSLALHEITLKVNLVIIKSCKALFAHWLCHQNTCWLYGNRWVGVAGPPKYSTPWLVWTPINFLNIKFWLSRYLNRDLNTSSKVLIWVCYLKWEAFFLPITFEVQKTWI